MKITREYLKSLGFKPFCEDGELLFYQKFTKDRGTIAFEPPYNGLVVYDDDWKLSIKTVGLELKCKCSTDRRYKEILDFFSIKVDDAKVPMDREMAKRFIRDNGLVLPRCRRCSQFNYCDENCERQADAELLQYVMGGNINESNIKEFQ